MRPRLAFLDADLVGRVLDEAFALLVTPGIRVQSAEAIDLLASSGATVNGERVRIPEALVRSCLATVPHAFDLFDREGRPAVRFGADRVQFDPGSCGVSVLDGRTGEHRSSSSDDLVRLVRVADALAAYDAQSTAVVCHDVPAAIGDAYRLFLVLLWSAKPVVTGAFGARSSALMIDLLALDAGGRAALAERPRAVFDVCPSPPLTWSAFGSNNLMDLARAGVPAEIVSMPLAGAAAPVTLIGSIVQHAAECLGGIVIYQLASPGAPIVWGGAPAIVDMRSGATAIGAIETAMLVAGYTQVGRFLGLPTHGYLGASDSKILDGQAGLESGMTALVGALSGTDLISGAGMLDFLLTQSAEKLVVDAEAIGMIRRLLGGIDTPTATLALDAFAEAGEEGRFLELPETRRLFRREQFLPSAVIDRGSRRAWDEAGAVDTMGRARNRVEALLANHERPGIDAAVEAALVERIASAGREFGLEHLPGIPDGPGSVAAGAAGVGSDLTLVPPG